MGGDAPTRFEDWTLVGLIAVVIVVVMLAVVVTVVRPLLRRRAEAGSRRSVTSSPAVVVALEDDADPPRLAFELVDGTRVPVDADGEHAATRGLTGLSPGDQGMLHHDGERLHGFDRWSRPGEAPRA